MNKRLKPTNDFIFQKLFGEQESKDSLISLLNAILKPDQEEELVDLTVIENKQLSKEDLTQKTGRLDIRAETRQGVLINIEMQVAEQKYMAQRTLFYFSKLYADTIKAGEEYQKLKKTIMINILDFELLDVGRYHTTFHLYEDQDRNLKLTDDLEIHFIELPVFGRVQRNFSDPLHRWLTFMDDDIKEPELKELISMDKSIREAEDRLEYFSGNPEVRRLYEAREYAKYEWNSMRRESLEQGLEEGRKEGIKEGIEKGKHAALATSVRRMVDKHYKVPEIADLLGLTEEKVYELIAFLSESEGQCKT